MRSLKIDIRNNYSNMIFCKEQWQRKLTRNVIVITALYKSASFIKNTRYVSRALHLLFIDTPLIWYDVTSNYLYILFLSFFLSFFR